MRKAARVCRRMYESEGPALGMIVAVCGIVLILATAFFCLGFSPTARPSEWNLDLWLFLVLAASYAGWSFLRARGAVDATGGLWFILAAFGLWMRTYLFLLLFGMAESYGGRSAVEDAADADGRFLIGVHRYGGLVAFVLGLAMVAWCSRPITRRPDRAGRARS